MEVTLTVHRAKMTHNTEMNSAMDPFSQIIYKDQILKTKMLRNKGKTPVWNETFKFVVDSPSDDIKIQILDADLKKDDLVGERTLKVKQLGGSNVWHELFYVYKDKDRKAGEIQISTSLPEPGEQTNAKDQKESEGNHAKQSENLAKEDGKEAKYHTVDPTSRNANAQINRSKSQADGVHAGSSKESSSEIEGGDQHNQDGKQRPITSKMPA